MLNYISRPQNNLNLTPTSIDIENIRCFATWGDLKHILNYNPTPMKAQFLPLLNDNLSQPQLNSTSTQFQINFDSISYQPHFNLNSTSTLTSTQYGFDIKATQSCLTLFCYNKWPTWCLALIFQWDSTLTLHMLCHVTWSSCWPWK